jgi:hypothetical protein
MSWHLFTLQDCIDIMAIDPPEKFTKLLDAAQLDDEGKQYGEVQETVTDEDLLKVFPDFYGRVIARYAGIDVAHMYPPERTQYFEERIKIFYTSLYYADPREVIKGEVVVYEPPEIKSFQVSGVDYLLPTTMRVFDQENPGANLQAIEFVEAADICLLPTGK